MMAVLDVSRWATAAKRAVRRAPNIRYTTSCAHKKTRGCQRYKGKDQSIFHQILGISFTYQLSDLIQFLNSDP